MKKTLILISLVSLAVILESCAKTGSQGPAGANGTNGTNGAQGNPGPVLTGNLKGYISQYDLSGAKILTSLSGDTVKMDGTPNFAITDANGLYTFSNITTGLYNLTVTKPGFGLNKIQSIPFTGGTVDEYRSAGISKTPTININNFTAIDTVVGGAASIKLRVYVTPALYAQTAVIFVGNPGSSTVTASSGGNSTYYTININPNAIAATKIIATTDLYDAGYAGGGTATVFFAAYLVGGNTGASSYVDQTNNRTVFTAVSPTPLFASAIVQ
jgi:hypothetical protein